MKRTKKASGSTRGGADSGGLGFNPPSAEVPTWETAVGSAADSAFTAYVPALTFKRDAMLDHPKFGRGKVLAVDGGRIEVLFNDGVKKLAHGLA